MMRYGLIQLEFAESHGLNRIEKLDQMRSELICFELGLSLSVLDSNQNSDKGLIN